MVACDESDRKWSDRAGSIPANARLKMGVKANGASLGNRCPVSREVYIMNFIM